MEGKTIFRNQNLWAEKVRTGGHQLQNENNQNLNCGLLRKVLQLHTYTCQKHSNTVPSLRRTGFPSQLPLLKINQCWTCQLAQQQTLQYFQKHKAKTTRTGQTDMCTQFFGTLLFVTSKAAWRWSVLQAGKAKECGKRFSNIKKKKYCYQN